MGDDWDDDSKSIASSSGGQSTFGKGFGRGRGRGRNNGMSQNSNESFGFKGRQNSGGEEYQNDTPGGFGSSRSAFGSNDGGFNSGGGAGGGRFNSRGRGGFGNFSNKDNNDESESSGFSNGFGNRNSKSEEFGSRGRGGRGFRGGSHGGFGSNESEDQPCGGGFSSDRKKGGFGGDRESGGFGRSGFGNSRGNSGFSNDGGSSGFGNSRGNSGFGNDGGSSGFGNSGGNTGFGNDGGSSSFGNDEGNGGFGRGRGRRGGRGGFGGGGSDSTDNFGANDGTSKPTEKPYVPPEPSENEEDMFKTLQKGINFDKYDNIEVKCTGDGVIPKELRSFDEAGLPEILINNISRCKYEKPTPIQKYALPIVAESRDIMACAQTGSGKTAAFLLPVLARILDENLLEGGGSHLDVQKPAVVIVGPTRELVSQIHNESLKFCYGTSIKSVVLYGGTSLGYQLRKVEAGAHVVVGTPGRLLDVIRRGKISLEAVKFLILDEADRMLDMGFEGDIRDLCNLNIPGKTERQTLMFSATFPQKIQLLAKEFLNNYIFVAVGRVGGANQDIKQTIYQVEKYQKRDKLVEVLGDRGDERTLIFAKTKRDTDFLACFLSQEKFPSTSIHGDRYQREREEALADFKSGRAPILVATSVAARGLDIPGVMHVINYDLPDNIDEHVHRIGRTGRCGNLGKATTFFDSSVDAPIARDLTTNLAEAQQEVPQWLEDMAERSTGGGFSGSNSYGGSDFRKGGGGFQNSGGDFNSSSSGMAANPVTAGDDDEGDWD